MLKRRMVTELINALLKAKIGNGNALLSLCRYPHDPKARRVPRQCSGPIYIRDARLHHIRGLSHA